MAVDPIRLCRSGEDPVENISLDDGMPDVWEEAQGLDPANAGDGPATAANGYTNVDNYLNKLV